MLIMNSSASPSQEIPIECESLYFKRKLHNVPPKVNVALVSSLVLNCVTFPFTVVLNLLLIAAVKTRQRLRTNHGNHGSVSWSFRATFLLSGGNVSDINP